MVSENDSVQSNEYVYRRVLNQPNVIDLSKSHPVQRLAFRPTNNDVDGLSVFRSPFTSPEEVAESGPNPSGYYVLQISVEDILALGLTVIPNPQSGQPDGHALIPEVNSANRDNRDLERASKAIQQKLTEIANRNIDAALVYSPE